MEYVSIFLPYIEVLLSQFEWKSRDSPTETRLTDCYRSTDSLSFVFPARRDITRIIIMTSLKKGHGVRSYHTLVGER